MHLLAIWETVLRFPTRTLFLLFSSNFFIIFVGWIMFFIIWTKYSSFVMLMVLLWQQVKMNWFFNFKYLNDIRYLSSSYSFYVLFYECFCYEVSAKVYTTCHLRIVTIRQLEREKIFVTVLQINYFCKLRLDFFKVHSLFNFGTYSFGAEYLKRFPHCFRLFVLEYSLIHLRSNI